MDLALFVVDKGQTIFKGWHVDLDIKIRVLVVISFMFVVFAFLVRSGIT